MKNYFLLTLLFICAQFSFSQGFEVKDFRHNLNDGSAFQAPLDSDGHSCGLVKVRIKNPALQFKGNIVGEVENKMNEYWVYMSQGSKQLSVLHPNFLPVNVYFRDFGIEEISSKATYILTLNEKKYKPEKTVLTITLRPESAALIVDDVLVNNLSGNGLYQLYLPKGNHICRFEQEGYRPSVQAITTGKGEQSLNIELESLMAGLEVKCKTGSAEIYIDGVEKGNGSWKGSMLPGEHRIEVRQQNFESYNQTISLAEKESRTIAIPELKRLKGVIIIETTPAGIPIIVDGENRGKSPATLEVETGAHYVMCNPKGRYGCESLRQEFTLSDEEKKILRYSLKPQNEEYQKAYGGNLDIIIKLACERYWVDDADAFDEALFWANRIPNIEKLFETIKFDGSDYSHSLVLLYAPERMEDYLRTEESNDIWKRNLNGFGTNLAREYGYLGDSYKKRKEYLKAIECYKKENMPYSYESIGDCYLLLGNVQEAKNQYNICLRGKISDYTRDKVEKKLKELDKIDNEDIINNVEERTPSFPGGPNALAQFLQRNLKYPPIAEENGIKGLVICEFVVDCDGSLTDIKVVKGVDPSLDREAVRVIKAMPKWIPGRENGKAIPVKLNFPLTFSLQ